MTAPNFIEPAPIGFRDLVAEWRSELATLVRERFPSLLGHSVEHIGIDVGETEIGANIVKNDEAADLGRVPLHDEHAALNLSALLSSSDRLPRGWTDVALQFEQSQVLRPKLQLPSASKSTLRQAAFYELERLSPIDPAQVYFDVMVLRDDPEKKKTDIELRIVKKAIVDDAVSLCHAAGLAVGTIGFEGDAHEADRAHFPVDLPAFLRMRWRRFSIPLLGAAALALLLVVLLAAYLRGSAQADLLLGQVETAGERAAVVHRMAHDIRDIEAQIEFPLQQKRVPLVVNTLAQLTRILPDGTWLTEFSVSGNKVHIQGFSKSASDLIGLIDKSPYFANAQFQASLQIATDNAEHFDLSFETKAPEKK
jgi:general secretion pathway protein L